MRRDQHFRPKFFILLLIGLMVVSPTQASTANTADGRMCDQAAIRAAREMGVPENVLLAVTRTETARYGTPWPWTVNMEGDGHWFETREAAQSFAESRQVAGADSFDVGCFQINHRWHGGHFVSIDAMLDPDNNARYAARFLIELFAEYGNWDGAVGAYHSRTDRYAARYLRIYHGHLETLGGRPDMPPPGLGDAPSSDGLASGFLLLQAGGDTALGSLVPNRERASTPLFEARP